jgi:hypothetical protein
MSLNPEMMTREAMFEVIGALEVEVAALKLSNDIFVGAQEMEARMNATLSAMLSDARAEVERLKGVLARMREGLELIANGATGYLDRDSELAAIARVALEAKP